MEGFSLIEMMLVVALLSTVAVASFPIFTSFLNSSELNSSADIIRSQVRRAQLNAQGANQDSAWGIYISGNIVTVYQGDDYSSRDTSDDLETEFAGDIEATGDLEINFAKVTGYPATTATINLEGDGASEVITITEFGLIE